MTALAFRVDTSPDLFQDDFARNGAKLPGAGLAWLDGRRRAAIDAYAKTGLPTRRVEAWKYTDLANALETDLVPATRSATVGLIGSAFGGLAATRLQFVDGFLHSVSDPDSIEVVDLASIGVDSPDWVKDHLGCLAVSSDQPLGAASLALMRGGVALRVPRRAAVHLDFIHTAQSARTVAHMRILILLEESASLRLLESHSGEGNETRLSNIGMEFVLKRGAKLEHMRLQADTPDALHITSLGAALGESAEYRALYAALGARLSRVDANIQLDAPGAHATLNNIAVLDSGIADITTIMDHAKPHTTSRQLFKSVVGGRGRAVNQGRVKVREGAVKSDSHQLFKSVLLSPRAEADAKPELEIFADDVVCGHGTAIGSLDPDALFYLRARGIPEKEARGLLVRAFLEDAIEGSADEAVHDVLWQRLETALSPMAGSVG